MKRETFLDKEVGYKFTTDERTIKEDELETFYNLWEDRETLFTDDAFAKSLDLNFEGKIVAGLFLVGVMLAKLDMLPGAGLAFDAVMLGMNDIKFVSAAYPGDRLRMEGELVSKRTTSKGHIIVEWKWILMNQNDTVLVSGTNSELFPKEMTS